MLNARNLTAQQIKKCHAAYVVCYTISQTLGKSNHVLRSSSRSSTANSILLSSAGAMPREFTDTTLPPQKRRILRLMCFWLWSRSLLKACRGMLFIRLDLTWAHFSWPSDLRCDLQDLQMVTTEVWLENKLPGLPKNTGVIVHCPQVLWKTLTRPNYYNITVIYINTCFRAERAEIWRALVTKVTQCHKWWHFDAAYLT